MKLSYISELIEQTLTWRSEGHPEKYQLGLPWILGT